MRRTLAANLRWLSDELRSSREEGSCWRIVVGHYVYGPTVDKYKSLMRESGAQLYVGGHTHSQAYFPAEHPTSSGVATLLVGAGGGIQIENPASRDQYGFGTLRLTRDRLRVQLISDYGATVNDACITPDSEDVACNSSVFQDARP